MDHPADKGRQLAQRHRATERDPTDEDRSTSLVHYAESSRAGDWSLRSALVRVAQPEPVRAGAVLELIRRCDASLAPVARTLETTMVSPVVGADGEVIPERSGSDDEPSADERDVRMADLARVARRRPDLVAEVLAGYREVTPLDDDEVEAVNLLSVAVVLDELAVALTDWAAAGAVGSPPNELVDRLSAEAFATLEALGVPREDRPGPPSRRGRP